ncbi:MAG: helix-turn-helix domain-containing protein [Bacteroidetes bacterium]|nr:helix-turn-helix domain-containing protein [Bacteroidota bacterium]MCL5737814.1 helix-turn-helix domain-containing protein [Bacteroidota bacterium]
MVALPFCHFEKTTKKALPKGYPKDLKTIGDHVRKRRLDLKLTQKEVAAILGVDECTVWNWEKNRTRPLPSLIARISEFLACPVNAFRDRSEIQRNQV